VLLEHGGLYFDTDHVLLRPIDELLRFNEVSSAE
jgi:mannosyltransferase OCH1-like enzyme